MKDTKFVKYLEEYIFSADRSGYIDKLLPDTDEHTYLKLTHEINQSNGEISGELKDLYTRLIEKKVNTYDYQQGIKLRYLLFLLDRTADESQRAKVSTEINKLGFGYRFTHKRPKIAEGMVKNANEESKYDSSLEVSESYFEEQVEALQAGTFDELHNVTSIKSGYLMDLNLDKLLKKIVEKKHAQFPSFLNELPSLSGVNELSKIVLQYLKKDSSSSNMEMIFKKMTLDQLVTFGKEAKDLNKDILLVFVNELYHKSFPTSPSVNKVQNIDDLKMIYKWSLNSKISSAFPTLKRLVLKHLLLVLTKNKQTESELLEDFIKNPSEFAEIFNKDNRKQWKQSYESFSFISDDGDSVDIMITEQLQLLFQNGSDVTKYGKYFNEAYLKKVVTELKLKQGEKIDKISQIFTKEEMEFLKDEKYMVFVSKKSKYNLDEDVEIVMDIKNVKKVVMKVFEINTVNYCKDMKSNVQDNIKLDGLISISEQVFTFEQGSIVSHQEKFTFEQLKGKKRGVFVIDFFGDGISSRTIIRKGHLNFIYKKTRMGYNCKILDEKMAVCKGEDTGLYFESKFYPANSEGIIKLEYPASSSSYNLILQTEGFCYVTESYPLEYERIDIMTGLLFDEETLFSGNKASILFSTKMFVSGLRVPLSNLKECNLNVEFLKAKNMKSNQKIDGVQLCDDKDYEISVLIPHGTNSINVTANITYFNLKGELQTYSNCQTITMLNRDNQAGKTHVFLNKVGSNYYLHHLGKNGEPMVGTEILINLQYIWKSERVPFTKITDESGRVCLGPLKGVVSINCKEVELQGESLNTFFKLWDEHTSFTMKRIVKTSTEVVELPILKQYENKGIEYVLLKVNKQMKTIIEDCSDLVSKKGNFYSIDKLAVGDYVFRYTKSAVKVDIQVVAGSYLNDEMIQLKDRIISNSSKSVTISNIVDHVHDSANNNLEILVDKFDANTRVHIFSHNFLPEGENRSKQTLAYNSSFEPKMISEQRIKEPKISYLEDRQLSGEMLYAINRKNNEPAIGTTSEKPSLFIKKREIRDTTYQSEGVSGGNDYDYENNDSSENEVDNDEEEAYGGQRYGRGKGRKEVKRANNRKEFMQPNDDYTVTGHCSGFSWIESSYEGKFEKMRHFLKNPSNSLVNLKPDQKGRVVANLAGFKSLSFTVHVVNEYVSSSKVIDLSTDAALASVDLRLAEASDVTKAYAYERGVWKLSKGTKEKIPFSSECDYEIIDTLSKLVDLKYDLTGAKLDKKWDFLKNWNSMELLAKMNVIDEMFSYELCLFLFKKDKDFFNETLREYIRCKIDKTLVDYYLLEDKAQLKRYLQSHKTGSLNSLEVICLIDSLHGDHKEQCTQLLNNMIGSDALNSYEDNLSFNQLFDRIINLGDKKASGGEIVIKRQQRNNIVELGEDDDDSDNSGPGIKPARNANRNANRNCDDDDCSQGSYMEEKKRESRRPQRARKEVEQCEEEEEVDMGMDLFGNEYLVQEEMNMEQECQQEIYQECEMPRARDRKDRNAFGGDSCCDEESDADSEDEDHDKPQRGAYNLMNVKQGKKSAPQLARLQLSSMKATKEYKEINYFYIQKQETRYPIQENKFWIDLAKYLLGPRTAPFLSENFVYVENKVFPFVVAFMDLEETVEKFKLVEEESGTHIEVSGNSILYLKHMIEKDGVVDTSNTILAAQKWFDRDNRYEYNAASNTNQERAVNYFIKGKIYGSQVVVTNVSSVEQNLQIITEVPEGSLPVIINDYHQTFDFKLGGFSTQKFEFFFYFPVEGSFKYCPACITREGFKIQAQASATAFSVLTQHPQKDELTSISDILAQGNKVDILNFMKKENIANSKIFNFSDIYWLLKDKEFYTSCTGILKTKLLYDETVWSYSFYHGDKSGIFELMANLDLKKYSMQYFHNGRGGDERVEFNQFQFKEYHPIVSARFHQLSKEKTSILNVQFLETYLSFLQYYVEKESYVTAEDRLMLIYYLLLQDRIDEAILLFHQLAPEDPALKDLELQYDYMTAYFDLYKGMPEFKKARGLCEKYLDYPVITWRSLFMEIANQLSDFDGDAIDEEDSKAKKQQSNEKEILQSTIHKDQINILYSNIAEIKVEFFTIDLEVLFSLYPFVSNECEKLIFCQPHGTVLKPVENTNLTEKVTIPIDERFVKNNLIVKVTFHNHRFRPVPSKIS
jgi:hypothetical protein